MFRCGVKGKRHFTCLALTREGEGFNMTQRRSSMKRKALLDYAITVCANFSVIGLGILLLKDDAPWQTGFLAIFALGMGTLLAWKKGGSE
jgi:hypothetical protein